ncbi:MAG: PTS lactose transporter subunit IIB [Brachybacterium sp.]|nr:PTS lactose transporter subunit IIB [Brachybacterium sp.]
MRTIAIVCGAGVATSTFIASRVRDHLSSGGREARVIESTVIDLLSMGFTADIVVSTVEMPGDLGIPIVSGMPVLLGTCPEVTFADIDRLLDGLQEDPRADGPTGR